MNGEQLYRLISREPGITARQMREMGADDTAWQIDRTCQRHPYIYVSGWRLEYNQTKAEYVWAAQWATIPKPVDAPKPERKPK